MGFFSNLVSGVVKVGLTPIAIAVDAIEVVSGDDAENTKEVVSSATEDLGEAFENLFEGDL